MLFSRKSFSVLLFYCLPFCTFAAEISDSSMMGYPLNLIVSGKHVEINSCRDMVNATANGGNIEKITNQLDNYTYNIVQDELLNCHINSQLHIMKATKINNKKISISDVLRHIPASAIPEPGETDKSHSSHLSIKQYYPDIKISNQKAVTEKGEISINFRDKGVYKYPNRNKIHFIVISIHVADGTYGASQTYIIKNSMKSLWELSLIDYNTKF